MEQQDGFTQVGVVGAGFMGTGIAESTARAGIPVVLYEPDEAPLERSRERLDASLDRAVFSGRLDPLEAAAMRARVTWTKELAALSGCELVIEAIVEDPQRKAVVFA